MITHLWCFIFFKEGKNEKNSFNLHSSCHLFRGLSVHNFYAGYTKKAIIQLLCVIPGSILVFPAVIEFIWVLVDICTLTKDADGKTFA